MRPTEITLAESDPSPLMFGRSRALGLQRGSRENDCTLQIPPLRGLNMHTIFVPCKMVRHGLPKIITPRLEVRKVASSLHEILRLHLLQRGILAWACAGIPGVLSGGIEFI